MNIDYILSWKLNFLVNNNIFSNLDNPIILHSWLFIYKFGSILSTKSTTSVFLNINYFNETIGIWKYANSDIIQIYLRNFNFSTIVNLFQTLFEQLENYDSQLLSNVHLLAAKPECHRTSHHNCKKRNKIKLYNKIYMTN